jgi:hypothetical protein
MLSLIMLSVINPSVIMLSPIYYAESHNIDTVQMILELMLVEQNVA